MAIENTTQIISYHYNDEDIKIIDELKQDNIEFKDISTATGSFNSKIAIKGSITNDGEEQLPVINAIDIDWNNAYLPNSEKTISTTGELLSELDKEKWLTATEYLALKQAGNIDSNTIYNIYSELDDADIDALLQAEAGTNS